MAHVDPRPGSRGCEGGASRFAWGSPSDPSRGDHRADRIRRGDPAAGRSSRGTRDRERDRRWARRRRTNRFRGVVCVTDRASSATLAYVLSLGIVALLISGVFFTAGEFAAAQNERVIRSELRVVGHHIAADISNVDQLAVVNGDSGSVRVTTDLPPRVAGKSYTIHLAPNGTDRSDITLNTTQPDVSQTVSVKTTASVSETRVSGGDIEITYNGTRIEMDHA